MPDAGDFVPFIPRTELTAAKSREAFIQFCRTKLTTFGADLDFDSYQWDVSDAFKLRGQRTQRQSLNFTAFSQEGKGERDRRVGLPLPDPLAAFAKAYLRYHVAQKQPSRSPRKALTAFRVLATALGEKGLAPDIGLVDGHVLDHAVEVCRRSFGQMQVGDIAGKLAEISDFIRSKRLSDRIPVDWRHGVARPAHMNYRLGADSAAWREERLPSRETLDAIPVAFDLASEPRDVILTSVMALLCCAPDRINEVFALPLDCEVEENVDGKVIYGLRWAGSKGHHDFLKPIIHVMADTAKTALARLRKHTAQARTTAAWYEHNPDKLYLSTDCERLRGQELLAVEIADITGMSDGDAVKAWARNNDVRPVGMRRVHTGRLASTYNFADVERAILSLLPPGFPVLDPKTGLRYSEALLVVRRYEFGAPKYLPWQCMVSPLSYDTVKSGFGGKTGSSVFERLGISTEERSVRLTSHQLRHYLNTLAMKADVSQVDIAAWSGRRDVKQNAAYDHETAEEILERQRRMEKQVSKIRADRDGTQVPMRVPGNPPVSRWDILARGEHGHATEIGFCRHDFASTPCPMFMECLHCTEHVCIKGYDPRQVEKIRGALELARSSLEKAQKGMADGYEGAEEWVQAHMEIVQRLEQLLALLTDSKVPDGTRIVLAKSGRYTLVEQAMCDHDGAVGRTLPNAPSTAQILASVRHAAD